MARDAAFIFDMDGTLVDSMPYHLEAWRELLTARGLAWEPDAFLRQTAGKTNRQILQEMFGQDVTEAQMAAWIERKEGLYRTLFRPHLRSMAGLMEFLDAARRLGVPLAIATSAGRANRDFVLEGLGIACYFDAVVGVEDVQNGKPDPEIFVRAAARLGVPPRGCLVFEDALAGIEAASRAGMRAVALTTTVNEGEFRGLPAVLRIAGDFTSLDPQSLLAALGRPGGGPHPAG